MKYPVSLSQRIDEVAQIVENWPVEKELREVLNWLMQFDNEDIDLGIRIIRNLNVIGFEDLNTALTIAYSKLERMAIDKGTKITNKNTLFAGIGDGAKSGAMIGYNFRIINELSEDNFMGEDSINYLEDGLIDNIVLVDDIVGTGQQATEEIKQLTKSVTPLGVKNIFLLTAVGMQDGIKDISDNTKAHVFSAFEYTELDTVNSLDAPFYNGIPHEERADAKSRLEYYGKISSTDPLGYGGIGALIAFYYNTPNISLPIIWGAKNSWLPLFKRAVKISGINSYYKKIETSINKKKKDKETLKGSANELVILVESNQDEVFFDYIISLIRDKLPFEGVNIISLGGFGSKKLIDNISRLNSNCLFIVEDDPFAPPGRINRFKTNIGEKGYILVEPFIYYLNLNSFLESERWAPLLSKVEKISDLSDRDSARKLERAISRHVRRKGSRSHDIFHNYLEHDKIIALTEKILELYEENIIV